MVLVATKKSPPGFRQSETQTCPLSYRDQLENWKFASSKSIYNTFQKVNNKGTDQTAQMRRLVWAFVVRKPRKTRSLFFSRGGPYNEVKLKYFHGLRDKLYFQRFFTRKPVSVLHSPTDSVPIWAGIVSAWFNKSCLKTNKQVVKKNQSI